MGLKHRRGIIGVAIATLIVVLVLNLITSRYQTHVRSRLCEGELRTVNWSDRNLEGIDCSHQILREANLSESNLRGANLRGSDFSGAATYLDDADLRGADLTQAILNGTTAIRADFSGATLKQADLSHANLNGAHFKGADLQDALLIRASLIAADLRDLKQAPTYLDGANLTDALIGANMAEMRLCNTIMPDGGIAKQGCYWPSYALNQSVQLKHWRSMDQDMSSMFVEALKPTQRGVDPADYSLQAPTVEQIRSMPCKHLKTLDQLWRTASSDRFGFGIQRQLWESPAVNRDYTKFGEIVGWKRNGSWLKWIDLPNEGSSETLPLGMFPWHQWQVQEPTPEEPTRFRRVGFGEWMAQLKQCGI